MSERIGRLCDELRIKLHGLDRRLEALKANGVATFDHTQGALESQLDRVENRIYDHRVAVEAANVRVKAWVAEKKFGLQACQITRSRHEKIHLLESQADDAETYAAAVFELATAAADEAILAVLQALLARNRADSAAFPEMDPLG
jgi:hypothetical protein